MCRWRWRAEDKEIKHGDGVWMKVGWEERWKGRRSKIWGGNLYLSSGAPLWIHIDITSLLHLFTSLQITSFRFIPSPPHLKPHDNLMLSIRKLEIGDIISYSFLAMTQYSSSPLSDSLCIWRYFLFPSQKKCLYPQIRIPQCHLK